MLKQCHFPRSLGGVLVIFFFVTHYIDHGAKIEIAIFLSHKNVPIPVEGKVSVG